MLKVIDVTLDYKNEVGELIERRLEQLRRSKRTIHLHGIQWISITTVCFLLIYGTGTLALNSITPPSTGPARSDLQADYGEWMVQIIPRVDPEIVEEIKRDNPNNSEVFKDPEEMDPYKDPFIIIQGQEDKDEPPILDPHQPTAIASEPTNTRTPEQSPTATPIGLESPTPTPTTMPTISPTNTPIPTQPATYTPVPPNPTSPPPPTDQSLVAICHKPGDSNQRTLHVPPSDVADHIAHGDYLGECTNP